MIFQYAVDQPFRFSVLGISHWNTPVEVREKFALSEQAISELIRSNRINIPAFFILSTCNRTEVYAFGSCESALRYMLTGGDKEKEALFEQYGYVKSNHAAIRHLYMVSSGLDSQILGDFQVMGQIRAAYQLAVDKGTVNSEMSRLVQDVFRTAKKIRRSTKINAGASSTAYAAVKLIRRNFDALADKRVLLYGVGKIGKIICSNLTKHVPHEHITVINRTFAHAAEVAESYEIVARPQEELQAELDKADIVIVATGAKKPVLVADCFSEAALKQNKCLIDLSVPRNIDPALDEIANFEVFNLDHLSDLRSKDLQARQADIPEAMQIIHESYFEFYDWLEVRKLSPAIVALKERLEQIKSVEVERMRKNTHPEEMAKVEAVAANIVNKIARHIVNHLKDNVHDSDRSISTLQEIFEIDLSGSDD